MKVRALSRAQADLVRIAEYVAGENPLAAPALIQRIQERIRDLAEFPEQGRPLHSGLGVLVITGTPYVAVYRIAGAEV
jgi:toxin ParE1/3/4